MFSPADDVGLHVGDARREVNHILAKDLNDYKSAINKSVRKKPVLFLVNRMPGLYATNKTT